MSDKIKCYYCGKDITNETKYSHVGILPNYYCKNCYFKGEVDATRDFKDKKVVFNYQS